ncbi:heme d1 biosynthesis radical SAM protein NirJ2 [Vallitalea longa]|uniref:Heme d1 biosynthesis radical SAM protein NirJ2 n=1 Tax=Vallitalea longa TaxID=2936439 RepID=A0A9W5YED5_9FIRM|nr:radical SAM protein [Vallitalea longa]GKX30414.1 heme d1 biosynthesis radical SAM protein NirJ2 [Vallitalea longa]
MKLRCATMKVTSRCNLRCEFCYEKQDNRKELSKDQIKHIIKFLKDNGCRTLMISGGEPLLRKDIYEIIEYASSNKIKTKLATNGTLLNCSVANRLKESGLDDIYISVGDMQDSDRLNNFYQTLKSYIHLSDSDFKIGVNVITSKTFINNINQHFNKIINAGIKTIFLIPPKPGNNVNWYRKECISSLYYIKLCKNILDWLDLIEISTDCAFWFLKKEIDIIKHDKLMDNYNCPAADSSFVINKEGLIYPCAYFELENYCAGNILNYNNVLSIFDSPGFQNFKIVCKSAESLFTPCISCKEDYESCIM